MASARASEPSSEWPVEAPVMTPMRKGWPEACDLDGAGGDGVGDFLGGAGGGEAAEGDGLAVLDQIGGFGRCERGKVSFHKGGISFKCLT